MFPALGGFMKKAFAVSLILLLFSLSAIFAAEQEKVLYSNDKNETQAFGVHFGNVSGNGYAYRYMSGNLGLQLAIGGFTSGSNNYDFPNYYEDYIANPPATILKKDKGRKYNFNVGANLIFPLKRTGSTLFYVHGGGCWKYSDEKIFYKTYELDYSTANNFCYYQPLSGVSTSHKVKSYMNVGLGPGFEINAGKYFKLVLELPVTYTGNDEFIMYIPQVGFYYYFK